MNFSLAVVFRFFAQLFGRGPAPRTEQARTVKRYRPERHYMRGPGPQWHAKHDPVPAPGRLEPGLR
jgi:hypothetical protein